MAEVGPTEKLLGTALNPIFPFFVLKIKESSKITDPDVVVVDVHKELYKYLVKNYGKDEIIFYLDPLVGQIAAWTPSMHSSFSLLNKIGATSNPKEWITKARVHLKNILSRLEPAEKGVRQY